MKKKINIMDYIKVGYEHAITGTQLSDRLHVSKREVRHLVNEARKSNVIANLQDGKGYFVPSESESELATRYIFQEMSRATEIENTLSYAKFMFF